MVTGGRTLSFPTGKMRIEDAHAESDVTSAPSNSTIQD